MDQGPSTNNVIVLRREKEMFFDFSNMTSVGRIFGLISEIEGDQRKRRKVKKAS